MRILAGNFGELRYQGERIVYQIVRRPAVKRRVHLDLGEDGSLQVVAPRRMSRASVHAFLKSWAPGVQRFLVEARARQREIPSYRYVSGERHLYLGQTWPLEVRSSENRRSHVALVNGRIRMEVVSPGPQAVQKQLQRWYRERAHAEFSERLAAIARRAPWTRGQVPDMRLRLMKRTWGNCSAGGLITLNPHLVKAPPELVDYVIAHEICHLREHNHGKAFYALQNRLYPNWREARERLKTQGHRYLHT